MAPVKASVLQIIDEELAVAVDNIHAGRVLAVDNAMRKALSFALLLIQTCRLAIRRTHDARLVEEHLRVLNVDLLELDSRMERYYSELDNIVFGVDGMTMH